MFRFCVFVWCVLVQVGFAGWLVCLLLLVFWVAVVFVLGFAVLRWAWLIEFGLGFAVVVVC